MLNNVQHYIDAAKERNGYKSDRALDRALALSGAAVSHWRTGRSFPTDDTMVKLADLAGIDRRAAMLDLCIWRTAGAARKVFEDIAKTAAAVLLVFALSNAPPVAAGDDAASR